MAPPALLQWVATRGPTYLAGLAKSPWVGGLCGAASTLGWLAGVLLLLLLCVLLLCLLLLLPLPRSWRRVYRPAVIGTGALAPRPLNLALLHKEQQQQGAAASCGACESPSSRSWGYLLRLSGLVRPWHAHHKRGLLGALACRAAAPISPAGAPDTFAAQPNSSFPLFLLPHSAVDRFAGWGGEAPVASPNFSEHPSFAADLHKPIKGELLPASPQQQLQKAWFGGPPPPADAAAADAAAAGLSRAPGALSEALVAAGAPEGAPEQCKSCQLAASWLQSPALHRQQLLQACPSLGRGFAPSSLLLQHRLVQGLLLFLQEETGFVRLIKFDKRYWVTSVDGDRVLLHYYRHRTDPAACRDSWGPAQHPQPAASAAAAAAEAAAAAAAAAAGARAEDVGCTDSRFPHGRPHGRCGCRGILFIVGGIGAKAYDMQVQHVVLLAAAKGFCVFFLSCLRGIEAPISDLPTDLTTSADVQAALSFILHLHVNGFKDPNQQQQQQQQQQQRGAAEAGAEPRRRQQGHEHAHTHQEQQHWQQQQQQQQHRTVLTMDEVDEGFCRMITEGEEEAFLKSIPDGFIPPVFLMGYSMGSCAILRLLGSLGLQQAFQQLQQQLQQQQQREGSSKDSAQTTAADTPSSESSEYSGSSKRSNSNSSSSSSQLELSPFCRDLAAAVASEYVPCLEWLRFLKGAVTISNAMCLDSCIGSLDRAGGVTGRLCKSTMLKMYKVKQWLEPSNNYLTKGLDPGLIALSQMTSTLREIDLLTHLSICFTPSSPLSCTRVYYALTTCLPHMLLVPVPLLCLHALDDPIVEPLAVCRAAATVPKYNPNCTYAVVGRGGHNLFQESFWPLIGTAVWRWLGTACRNISRNFSGDEKAKKAGKSAEKGAEMNYKQPRGLYVDHSFQARVAVEFITAVWRRCD